jgi:hypothetical protein
MAYRRRGTMVLTAAFGLRGFGIISRVLDRRPREIGQR